MSVNLRKASVVRPFAHSPIRPLAHVIRIACCCLFTGCGPAMRAVPTLPPPVDVEAQLPRDPRLAWKEGVGAGLLSELEARGDFLFATTTNRALVALAQANGQRYWRSRFDGAITTGTLLGAGRIYFATEERRGTALAVDQARGRTQWSRRIGPARLRPLQIEGAIVFATEQGELFALTEDRGTVRWQTRLPGAVLIRPIRVGNLLITATATDSVYGIDVGTGAIQLRAPLAATPSAPAALVGGSLYVPLHNGRVAVVDPGTLRTQQLLDVKAPVLAAPTHYGQRDVYFLTRDAEVWHTDGASLRRIAALGSAARASLAMVGDVLVAGLLDGRLVALDRNGAVLWQYQAPRSIHAPVTAWRQALYVPLMNGDVLKLQ